MIKDYLLGVLTNLGLAYLGLCSTAATQAVEYYNVDHKNYDQVSVIFKIYKTKIEDYFTNTENKNWKQMFKAYADASKAKKAAGAEPAKN